MSSALHLVEVMSSALLLIWPTSTGQIEQEVSGRIDPCCLLISQSSVGSLSWGRTIGRRPYLCTLLAGGDLVGLHSWGLLSTGGPLRLSIVLNVDFDLVALRGLLTGYAASTMRARLHI